MALVGLSLMAALNVEAARADELGDSRFQHPTPYDDLVCSYQDWGCVKPQAVLWCESSGNPGAYSSGNRGLFQINEIHRARVGGDVESLYDAATNVRIAHDIWLAQGWGPWPSCGRL